nr:hypothetical protein HUO10_005031 [Paraburkholderia busanensis]
MGALVVVDGDLLNFLPAFGQRQVTVTGPAVIRASGHALIGGKRVCVFGDERRVRVRADYMMPGYGMGSGVITIVSLNVNQKTPRINDGMPLIVEGTEFIARFSPTVAAVMSGAPFSPDSTPPSMGKGTFQLQQQFVTAG